MDCLIIHVPKFQNWYRPLGNYTSLQLMALGIFALADAVTKAGRSAKIVHLGIEKALDRGFTIKRYLASNPPKIVAFSIQFHQQLYDSLRVAALIKEHDPSIFVIIGGMTATCFADDMLKEYVSVDAVIRGEGEKPLAQLVDRIMDGSKDLSGIPNLSWKKNGTIVRNEETYLALREDMDRLDFCNLPVMEHYQRYVDMPKIFTRLNIPRKLHWKFSKLLSQNKRRTFNALSVGRGCTTNCCYCGGGVSAQKMISSRCQVVFRSPERVIEDIIKLKQYGYDGAYISFDPPPESDGYYRSLFRQLRSEGLEFDLGFSSWAIPSREFIDEFHRTFSPWSHIAITPDVGSERLRKMSRGIYFSNEDLIDRLRCAEEKGVKSRIYFSLGIPGETREEFEETLRLRDFIKKHFKMSSITAFSIEIEPAAPWFVDPEKYGITLLRKELKDFIGDQKNAEFSTMANFGYYQKTYLGEPVEGMEDYAHRVLKTKCDYFCDKKMLCATAGCFWGMARILGFSPNGDVSL